MGLRISVERGTTEGCLEAMTAFLRQPTQQQLASLVALLSDYQDRWIETRVRDQERDQAR